MKFRTSLIAAGLGALASVATAQTTNEVERPEYEVVAADGDVELRRYAPRIEARIKIGAENLEAASAAGFVPLANYIFGENTPGGEISKPAPVSTISAVDGGGEMTGGDGQKIEMTAPVTTAPTDREGAYWVTFTMPSEWTMETLPAPENENIILQPLGETWMIATGYEGLHNPQDILALQDLLAGYIEVNELTPIGPFTIAGFSGPDTAPENREWEVQRAVEAPE
ncbi:MAG: heme-binding protein [Sulfitobacter sp.]|nr:heme-binding protein [Sulfitobacter sp.]